MLNKYTASFTTDGAGAATGTIGGNLRGRVEKVFFDVGSLAGTANIALSASVSGEKVCYAPLLSADRVAYPRILPVLNTTTATPYADWGVNPVLGGEVIDVVIDAGGASKTCDVTVWIDE